MPERRRRCQGGGGRARRSLREHSQGATVETRSGMRYTTYSKHIPELLDAINLQELLDQLSDFLLQSGFAADRTITPIGVRPARTTATARSTLSGTPLSGHSWSRANCRTKCSRSCGATRPVIRRRTLSCSANWPRAESELPRLSRSGESVAHRNQDVRWCRFGRSATLSGMSRLLCLSSRCSALWAAPGLTSASRPGTVNLTRRDEFAGSLGRDSQSCWGCEG